MNSTELFDCFSFDLDLFISSHYTQGISAYSFTEPVREAAKKVPSGPNSKRERGGGG